MVTLLIFQMRLFELIIQTSQVKKSKSLIDVPTEMCPFCGKTYKRLKSHLPHCKAAARSTSPPTNQTSSSQLISSSEPTATGETSLAESSKVSTVSSSPAATSTKKKKKPKLSEQIKMAVTSLNSAPPPDISKPKKKSVRPMIEAAKPDHVTKGSLEGTKSASRTQPPDPDPGEPVGISKKKAPKTKRAAQALWTTRDTDSDSLASEASKSSTSPNMRNDLWVETEDLSTNKMLLKPGSHHQARVTIQDVKATLGRVKTTSISNRIRLDASLSPAGQQKDLVTSLVTTKTKPKQTSLIPFKNNGSSHPKPNPQATPPPCTVGLKVSHHVPELPSVSQRTIQLSSQTLPTKVEMLMTDGKQNVPRGQTEGQCSKDTGGTIRNLLSIH